MFYYLSASVTIDLMLLLRVLLYLAGTAVLVILALILLRILRLLTGVSEIMDEIKDPVAETVESLPLLMDQVQVITENVADITDELALNSEALMADVASMTHSVQGLVGSVSDLGVDLSTVLNRVVNIFNRTPTGYVRTEDLSYTKIISNLTTALGYLRSIKKKQKEREKRKH